MTPQIAETLASSLGAEFRLICSFCNVGEGLYSVPVELEREDGMETLEVPICQDCYKIAEQRALDSTD